MPSAPAVDGRRVRARRYWEQSSRMAFVGQEGDYLAQLDPEKGAFENVALESGAGPHNLIVDEAGQVWFTPTIAIACGSWRQAPSRTG